MEQTTLQQRIEERAKDKLLNHLLAAANKEKDLMDLLGKANYTPLLNVNKNHYKYVGKVEIELGNEYSKNLFDILLPDFIKKVTDEILQKIDEIDYLLENKNSEYVE